jgi:hypothetical protein
LDQDLNKRSRLRQGEDQPEAPQECSLKPVIQASSVEVSNERMEGDIDPVTKRPYRKLYRTDGQGYFWES